MAKTTAQREADHWAPPKRMGRKRATTGESGCWRWLGWHAVTALRNELIREDGV
jgi:hypothetical protein